VAGGFLIPKTGEGTLWIFHVVILLTRIMWIAIPFLYFRHAGVDAGEGLYLRRPGSGVVSRLLLLWISSLWVIPGIKCGQDWTFEGLGLDFEPQTEQLREQIDLIRELSPVYALFLIGILTPVAEECVFRGALLSGLARSFGGGRAAVYSAAFFAAAHFMVPRMAITFFLGLTFALTVLWTRSLLAGILLHALNNISAFAVGLLEGLLDQPGIFLPTLAVAVATYLLVMISIRGMTAAPPEAPPSV